MGFKNRLKDINSFKPLDLSEDSVQTLFNRCLASKDSIDAKTTLATLLFTDELRITSRSNNYII